MPPEDFLLAPSSANDVLFADLDGDGASDLVAVNPLTSALEIVRQPSARTFVSAAPIFFPNPPDEALAVDLDGDRLPELVALTRSNPFFSPDEIRFLRNLGGGSFGEPQFRPFDEAVGLQTADLDGDGVPDVFATGSPNLFFGFPSYVLVLRGIGDGDFQTMERHLLYGLSTLAFAVDVDGDGLPDLVQHDETSLSVYRNLTR